MVHSKFGAIAVIILGVTSLPRGHMVFGGMSSMLTKGWFASEHGNSLLSMREYTIPTAWNPSKRIHLGEDLICVWLHFPALEAGPAQTCFQDLLCRDSTP